MESSSAFAEASRAFTLVGAPPRFSKYLASSTGPCPPKLVCRVTTGLCLLSFSRGTSVPLVCSEKLAYACKQARAWKYAGGLLASAVCSFKRNKQWSRCMYVVYMQVRYASGKPRILAG